MLPAQFFHVTSLKPKMIPTRITIILFRKIYFNTKSRGEKLQSKGQFFKLDESSLMQNKSSWGVCMCVCVFSGFPSENSSKDWLKSMDQPLLNTDLDERRGCRRQTKSPGVLQAHSGNNK